MQRFGLAIETPPVAMAISVATAKLHSRLLGRDSEDTYIEELISEAMAVYESQTGITLCTTTYRMTLDRFPAYVGTKNYPYDFATSFIKLPRNPVLQVLNITYRAESGEVIEVPANTYRLSNTRWPARIAPVDGQLWPFVKLFDIGSVTIRFTAGFGTETQVPTLYKRIIKYMFAHLYEHREPLADKSYTDIPFTLKQLINSTRYQGFTQW